MTTLSVNLNKIALLRNSRGRDFPSLEQFAKLAIDAGAGGLTIHPRPDERHARYSDVINLKDLTTQHQGIELNIEGYPSERFLETVLHVKPDQCTLVPDSPEQLTSDHGWDLRVMNKSLQNAISLLNSHDIRVSLFMDPDLEEITYARDSGVDRVELYTERWARAYGTHEQKSVLEKYARTVSHAKALGFQINAGHDLNLSNLRDFLSILDIAEVSIGHALIVESLHFGFKPTIKKYLSICSEKSVR